MSGRMNSTDGTDELGRDMELAEEESEVVRFTASEIF